MPAGIGGPVFDKLDASLSQAVMSIGAVKGIEFGEGFLAATLTGKENNDSFISENGRVTTKTNHCGGVLGGMSSGNTIVFRAGIKPTPSISQPQETVNNLGESTTLTIKGRHDPVIVPRAVVVVESMAAITLLDALMEQTHARVDYLKNFYK